VPAASVSITYSNVSKNLRPENLTKQNRLRIQPIKRKAIKS